MQGCQLIKGYQRYSRRLFYIYRKASWKTVLPSEAILRGLVSISIVVPSLSRDYILRFLHGIYNISGCYAFT